MISFIKKAICGLGASFLFCQGCIAEDWTINAGFEGLKEGERALGSGGFWGGAGQSEVVKSPNLREKSAKIWIKNNQTGFGKWGGDWEFKEKAYRGETVWFSVHTYIPEEFEAFAHGGGGRLKFLRMETKHEIEKKQGHVDFLVNIKGWEMTWAWIFEGEQKWVMFGDQDDLFKKDRWENYQMVVTFDNIPKDEGGMAETRLYKNGRLMRHITNRKTLKTSESFGNRAMLFTYWNGGGPKEQHMYVDEITVTNKKPGWQGSDGNPIVPFYTDPCRLAD